MSDYKLIRGARILHQLNEDSTTDDLEQNITIAFPNTTKRQNATSDVTILTTAYIPYIGTKFLHVKSTSSSKNGHMHKQALQFMKVIFENEDTPDNITLQAATGEDFHCQPIDLNSHNVKVRCDCLDMYYRFSHNNFGDNSLVGKPPPPYQRKTTNRPSVNPTRVPGVCKHVLRLIEQLQGIGLVR